MPTAQVLPTRHLPVRMEHNQEVSSGSREFWSQSSQVEDFPAARGALPYEAALITLAAAAASSSGPVDEVHVVGVGAGRELTATRDSLPEVRIRAWDISPQMVEACRRFVERTGLEHVSVGCRDVAELTEADGPADVVVLLNAVLCYVGPADQRARAAAALHSLLRPGGTLTAVVHQRWGRPDWAGWFAARAALAHLGAAPGGPGDRRIRHGGSTMLFHHFRPGEVTRLLADAGFVHTRVQSLRAWARSTGHRIPVRSPNPLLVVSTAGPVREPGH